MVKSLHHFFRKIRGTNPPTFGFWVQSNLVNRWVFTKVRKNFFPFRNKFSSTLVIKIKNVMSRRWILLSQLIQNVKRQLTLGEMEHKAVS